MRPGYCQDKVVHLPYNHHRTYGTGMKDKGFQLNVSFLESFAVYSESHSHTEQTSNVASQGMPRILPQKHLLLT